MGAETLDPIVYPLRKCISTDFLEDDLIVSGNVGQSQQQHEFAGQCGLRGLESLGYKGLPSFFATRCYVSEYTLLRPTFPDGLEFSSKFENGNLKKAIRVSRLEYELLLAEDFNTQGHFHWFYFRTSSTLPVGSVVHFKILNMIKPRSLYTIGYKPFVCSIKRRSRTSRLRSFIIMSRCGVGQQLFKC